MEIVWNGHITRILRKCNPRTILGFAMKIIRSRSNIVHVSFSSFRINFQTKDRRLKNGYKTKQVIKFDDIKVEWTQLREGRASKSKSWSS